MWIVITSLTWKVLFYIVNKIHTRCLTVVWYWYGMTLTERFSVQLLQSDEELNGYSSYLLHLNIINRVTSAVTYKSFTCKFNINLEK